jgi:hypothetical protein
MGSSREKNTFSYLISRKFKDFSTITCEPTALGRLDPRYVCGWLVYSCWSHLEHRASVKRFVSLQFLNLRHSVGLLGRVISPSQSRYLTQTYYKHTQTSMPRVRFEPTIPGFERAKTVHALDRAATVIGYVCGVYVKSAQTESQGLSLFQMLKI